MSLVPVRKLVFAGVAAAAALSGGHVPRAAGPASVPRYELTFRVIDRSGARVRPLDLQLLNLARGTNIDLHQGTRRQVRRGRYNVAGWIGTGTGSSQTFTLDDQIVTVTRNRTITLDARQGTAVRVRLNAAGAVDELLELAPIVRGFWAFNPSTIFVENPVGRVFVVPMRARLVTFYAYSVWEQRGNTVAHPSPFRYDIIDVHRGGIPARPSYAVRRSTLARVGIIVRATDASQQATLELNPMSAGGQILPLNAGTTLGATPARLVSYRTPGYQWQPIVDLQSPAGEIRDDVLNMKPYGRGGFRERYFAAVLAPQQFGIFADVSGRRLQAGISNFPLSDPLHLGDTDQGSGLRTLFRLFWRSRLLARSHGRNLNVRIPMARRWYSLHLDASRPPGATLSTQVHAAWRFALHGTTGGFDDPATLYLAQLLPAGLDASNRAAGGAVTPVAVRVYGNQSASPLLLAVVRAQVSTDDGTTWRTARIRRRGDHYVFSVRDPGQAGFVSLRVFVRNSAGTSERLTVIRAYGVR